MRLENGQAGSKGRHVYQIVLLFRAQKLDVHSKYCLRSMLSQCVRIRQLEGESDQNQMTNRGSNKQAE